MEMVVSIIFQAPVGCCKKTDHFLTKNKYLDERPCLFHFLLNFAPRLITVDVANRVDRKRAHAAAKMSSTSHQKNLVFAESAHGE